MRLASPAKLAPDRKISMTATTESSRSAASRFAPHGQRYDQPHTEKLIEGISINRNDAAAVGAIVCLTWWSFVHLSHQSVLGASPHEMSAQALESTALGLGWLLTVAAVAFHTFFRVKASPEPVQVRRPAPFPRPSRETGLGRRRHHGSADSDCTSRHPTMGCVPVGQYSSSSSRRAA